MMWLFRIHIIGAFWLAWLVLWLAGAAWSNANRWRESIASRLSHSLPLVLSGVLLSAPHLFPPILSHHVLRSDVAGWCGVALAALGIAITLWARWYLGRNWSGAVTVKEGHTLVRTGPYRWVRHPIYTGALLALFGTALAFGEARGLLAFLVALAGLVYKLRIEESRMAETFPDYARYRAESAALVPFIY